jgi:hypothetical protein
VREAHRLRGNGRISRNLTTFVTQQRNTTATARRSPRRSRCAKRTRPRENGRISRYFATFVTLALFLLFADESSARGLPAAEGDGAMKVIHGSPKNLFQEVSNRRVEAVCARGTEAGRNVRRGILAHDAEAMDGAVE